ncbi:zonadhesin isoform X2 [Lingula anatina]|uniref:Zonadhesin isoform X2 n=1 Tax=Lingula anatina TaxID=7574 RepID=A0A1S3HHR8_LINAN|nr:zonadhesin isoform X2 [Lingula anatina]|eukprot:XP_013385650.1 zonadhesin isoform X2 [Lingula anatina]
MGLTTTKNARAPLLVLVLLSVLSQTPKVDGSACFKEGQFMPDETNPCAYFQCISHNFGANTLGLKAHRKLCAPGTAVPPQYGKVPELPDTSNPCVGKSMSTVDDLANERCPGAEAAPVDDGSKARTEDLAVPTCENTKCDLNLFCYEKEVQCVAAPCLPVPTCVPQCELPKKSGPCFASVDRYFFNQATGQCETFTYGGCQPNENNFETLAACENTCGRPTPAITCANTLCSPDTFCVDRPFDCFGDNCPFIAPKCLTACEFPKKIGPCRASIPRLFYNAATKQCEEFGFGGCQGNANNFNTVQECQQTCAVGIDPATVTTKPPPPATCADLNCPSGTVCVQDTIFCVTAPCPQPPPVCVPVRESCRGGQVYNECGSACTATCENMGNIVCTLQCVPGCHCPPDRPLLRNGNCLKASECPDARTAPPPPDSTCTGGRVFSECASPCDPTCEEPNPICATVCVGRCACPSGTLLHEGNCISNDACPRKTCPIPGQVFKECGSVCERTCQEPNPACTRQCVQKCECPQDAPILDNGKCVPLNQCPVTPQGCTGGQVFNRCGSACETTCQTVFESPRPCTLQCVEKCECPPDKPVFHNGQCITKSQCPIPKCSGGQVFNECGSACTRTCSDEALFCTLQCVPRCECPADRPVLSDNGECIRDSDCKKPTNY